MTQHAIITVRFRVAGLHRWPAATGARAYLAHPHRHLFHIAVSTAVTHDDREIEFHDLQHVASGLLAGAAQTPDAPQPGVLQFGAQSCEALARLLADHLASHYRRGFQVSVSEDGEFEATVTADVPPEKRGSA